LFSHVSTRHREADTDRDHGQSGLHIGGLLWHYRCFWIE
jgi:hypothetical protein